MGDKHKSFEETHGSVPFRMFIQTVEKDGAEKTNDFGERGFINKWFWLLASINLKLDYCGVVGEYSRIL